MNISLMLSEVIRPLLLALPGGQIRLLSITGASSQRAHKWQKIGKPIRTFFDPTLGARYVADLRDWGGRWHYFAGFYYDQANAFLLRHLLGRQGIYVDVGANFGIFTVAASKVVANGGKVYAFEPNPTALERLREHLVLNNCLNVEVIEKAVGAYPCTKILNFDAGHLGTASFREVSGQDSQVSVSVTTLDIELADLAKHVPVLVKIDVEGFEYNVIQGATQLLRRKNIYFSVECTPDWQIALGDMPDAIFQKMAEHGFQAYIIKRSRLPKWKSPAFDPVSEPIEGQADYLFARKSELSGFKWIN